MSAYESCALAGANDAGQPLVMTIQGLQARTDLNGQRAEVLRSRSGARRWDIKVLGTGEEVAIKPSNLVVKACRVLANHGGWQTVELAAHEHADVLERGDRAPVLASCGLNLWVKPEARSSSDNQAICWLMIEADSGFAPMKWQSSVGHCVVARATGDFTEPDFTLVNDYCSKLIDIYGEGDGPPGSRWISPAGFQSFIRRRMDN